MSTSGLITTALVTVEDLIQDLRIGQLGWLPGPIPSMQRADVRDLLDDMFKGHPVGSVVIWCSDRTRLIASKATPLYALLRAMGALCASPYDVVFDLDIERFVPYDRHAPGCALFPLCLSMSASQMVDYLRALPVDGQPARHRARCDAANRVARSLTAHVFPIVEVHGDRQQAEDAAASLRRWGNES